MKNNCTCPKCKSTDVARLKAHKGTTTSNMIPLNKWATYHAYFDRYVCLSCGFLEDYVDLGEKSFQKWVEKKREKGSLDSDFV